MICFVGEYSQVIDAKNRVFIPAKYRETLGDKIFVTRNVDGCLSVYSEEGWSEYCEKLKALPTAEGSYLTRFIFSSTIDAKPDSQGRVVLSPALKEYAGLTKDIYIIGVGDHVEIWDKEKRDHDKMGENMDAMIEFMRKYNF